MKFSLSLCLILLPSIAFADARNGELFGYKIGDVYPITISTMGEIHQNGIKSMTVYAETPKKPKDIGNVWIDVTRKSFTIVKIESRTKFDSYEKAKSCAYRYEELLIAKYNIDDVSTIRSDDFSSLYINDYYRIGIIVSKAYEEDGSYDKGFIVYIDIEPFPPGSLRKKLDNLVQK